MNCLIVGANRGIGFAITRQLLNTQKVSKVFATFRSGSRAEELQMLKSQNPDRLELVEFNIEREEELNSLGASLKKSSVKSLELVICCIGFLHDEHDMPEKKLEELNLGQMEKSFKVNAIAAVFVAKQVKDFIREASESKFVAISAKVGSIGDNKMGGWYSYRASKAALNMFVKNIALEFSRLNPSSVTIALHPGTTETGLSKPFIESAAKKYQVHSAEQTASNLLKVIDDLKVSQNGCFLSWGGEELDW